jgi:sulfur-oxidizing protein SoxY
MNLSRRNLLKNSTATGLLLSLIAAGALRPTRVLAAEWNKAAFESKDMASALKALGAHAATDHRDLLLKLPDIAEDSTLVPVDVISHIPNTRTISILVEKNRNPLSAHFEFSNGALAEVSARIKLAESSIVKAVARADGKFYTVQKEVKVTIGGCGG